MNHPKRVLLDLYRSMLRIRLCEESLVEPILSGDVRCPVHLCSGQEAVSSGVCAALSSNDYVFGNHRSHGHYLAKGGSMEEMVAEIYGKETGCSRGRGGSMHLIAPEVGMLGSAPIVGGTISLAVGAALASSIRKDKRVTVSFFGDGATGEGVLCESLNFAALKRLPIIFACENNLYSTHLSIHEIRVSEKIYEIGKPFGEQSFRVDGNDVLKVYDSTKKAVDLCRKGKGPVFLEFLTYRMRGHVGPDDNIQGTHTDIRPKKEIAAWAKKDPIRKLELALKKHAKVTEEDLSTIRQQAEQEVAKSHAFARRSSLPKPEELHHYVFKQ